MSDRHVTKLRCAPPRGVTGLTSVGALAWRAVCTVCPWESPDDHTGEDAVEQARLDGQVHTTAPAGAGRADAVLTEWLTGG